MSSVHVARPAFDGVESITLTGCEYTPLRMFSTTVTSSASASSVIDIRAAQRSEVVQHQMDVTSNGRGRPGGILIRDTLHQWQNVSRSKRFVNGPSCSQRLWIFDLNPGLRRPGFITRREKRSKARATALSSVRTAPTTAPSWNLLFARGVQR